MNLYFSAFYCRLVLLFTNYISQFNNNTTIALSCIITRFCLMTSFIQRTIGLVVAAEAAAEEYCEGLRQAAVMPYEDVSQANKVFL